MNLLESLVYVNSFGKRNDFFGYPVLLGICVRPIQRLIMADEGRASVLQPSMVPIHNVCKGDRISWASPLEFLTSITSISTADRREVKICGAVLTITPRTFSVKL